MQFVVFNLLLGNHEGEELEKILYFYPKHLVTTKIRIVGLCDAFYKFARSFGETGSPYYIYTAHKLLVFSIDNQNCSVLILDKFLIIHPQILSSFLIKTNYMFKLFYGNIFSKLNIDTDDKNKTVGKKQLQHFYYPIMLQLEHLINKGTSNNQFLTNTLFADFTKEREPFSDTNQYIELQNEISTFENIYSPGLIGSIIFTRNGGPILWSTLDEIFQIQVTSNNRPKIKLLCLLTEYLSDTTHNLPTISSPLLESLNFHSEKMSDGKNLQNLNICTGRFLTFSNLLNAETLEESENDPYKFIYLPIDNWTNQYVLIAYQIYSYVMAIIFDKSTFLSAYNMDQENLQENLSKPDFLLTIRQHIENILGKQFLHYTTHSSINHLPFSTSLDKIIHSLHYLVVDKTNKTLRSNLALNQWALFHEMSDNLITCKKDKPHDINSYKCIQNDLIAMFYRLYQDVKRYPLDSSLIFKYENVGGNIGTRSGGFNSPFSSTSSPSSNVSKNEAIWFVSKTHRNKIHVCCVLLNAHHGSRIPSNLIISVIRREILNRLL